MGGFVRRPSPPTPPKPQPVQPTAVEVTQSQQADATPDYGLDVKKKGRRATILTKNTSLGGGDIQRKTLLGA